VGEEGQVNSDFPKNLRLLTDHFKSVAEVCRRLDLNRSQFNKYLSGRSNPSRHVLKSICDFFGVEEYEILLPHREFEQIISLKPTDRVGGGQVPAYTQYLDQLIRRSRGDLLEYEGFYFEYYYSMTYPGLVLRSLMQLKADAGVMTYQRMENLAKVEENAPRFRGRYQGMAFYLNDRIFLVDFDRLTGDEISQTVLYPNYKSRLTRLAGLKLGVATSNKREPLCARVVLVALGRKISVKKALRECGLFDPDSAMIDPEIGAMITNDLEEDAFHFRVVPDM